MLISEGARQSRSLGPRCLPRPSAAVACRGPPQDSPCVARPRCLLTHSAGRTPVDEALSSGHEALLDLINTFDITGGGADVAVEFEGAGGGEGDEPTAAAAGTGSSGGGGSANDGSGSGGAGDAGQRLAQEAKEKLAL
jgi:hypothetical protein